MEEIWNIKSFRNNIMIVSVLTILLLIFSDQIKEINVFWIIKLDNIKNLKLLWILLCVNIFVLLRYYQYLLVHEIILNEKLMIFKILNNVNISKAVEYVRILETDDNWDSFWENKKYSHEDIDTIVAHNNGSIWIGAKNWAFLFHNVIISNEYTWQVSKGWVEIGYPKKKWHYDLHILSNKSGSNSLNIWLKINFFKYMYIKIWYCFFDKNYADYYMPFLLSIMAILWLGFKLFSTYW